MEDKKRDTLSQHSPAMMLWKASKDRLFKKPVRILATYISGNGTYNLWAENLVLIVTVGRIESNLPTSIQLNPDMEDIHQVPSRV